MECSSLTCLAEEGVRIAGARAVFGRKLMNQAFLRKAGEGCPQPEMSRPERRGDDDRIERGKDRAAAREVSGFASHGRVGD